MKYLRILTLLALCIFQGCIGDDIIQDRVEPTIRIQNPLDTLAINTTYQFEHRYLNNVGIEESINVDWSSSNSSVVAIDQNGLAEALQIGSTEILVAYTNESTTINDQLELNVGMMTVEMENKTRKGTVATTSSYALEGDFELKINDNDELILSFADNYKASTALPGLFIYLTNNPNTTEQAFEIGAVTIFSGSHEYILGTGIDLFDYSHVLYFCKPFNVKVGDGPIE